MKVSVITPLKKGDPEPDLGPFACEVEHLVVTEGTANEAVNIGIKRATGEVITFLPSGDRIFELDLVAHVFTIYPKVDVVYGDCVISSEGKVFTYVNPSPKDLRTHLRYVSLATNAFFYRAESLRLLRGFDPVCQSAADYDCVIRAVEAGFTFKKVSEILAHWAKKPGSLSNVGGADQLIVKTKHADCFFATPFLTFRATRYFAKRILIGQTKGVSNVRI